MTSDRPRTDRDAFEHEPKPAGGIGGVAAALSLLESRVDAHVHERARELREVGAGIQISPNASRVLQPARPGRYLGAPRRQTIGIPSTPLAGRSDAAAHPPCSGKEAAFGSPHYQMHRADVLRTLVAALPSDRMHIGHRLTGIVDHGDRVEATFENGAHVNADVLVGAGGIHSTVRHILFGAEKPRFTGCMYYRGLVPAERLSHLAIPVEAQIWMG